MSSIRIRRSFVVILASLVCVCLVSVQSAHAQYHQRQYRGHTHVAPQHHHHYSTHHHHGYTHRPSPYTYGDPTFGQSSFCYQPSRARVYTKHSFVQPSSNMYLKRASWCGTPRYSTMYQGRVYVGPSTYKPSYTYGAPKYQRSSSCGPVIHSTSHGLIMSSHDRGFVRSVCSTPGAGYSTYTVQSSIPGAYGCPVAFSRCY